MRGDVLRLDDLTLKMFVTDMQMNVCMCSLLNWNTYSNVVYYLWSHKCRLLFFFKYKEK